MVDGIDVVPRRVRSFVKYAREKIGEEPQIEQLAPLLWRVVLAGKRIHASADFRAACGKTRWISGALTIDGEPRNLTSNWLELRTLWDKYERPAAERATLEPMPPLPEDARMPTEVRQLRDQLADALPEGIPVMVGLRSGRWVVGVDGPGGDGVRFTFERTAHGGRWTLADKRPIQLIAGGNDLSAEIGRDIGKAMAALTQAYPGTDAPSNGPAGKVSHGARDNGIESRKGNVIRVLDAYSGAWPMLCEPVMKARSRGCRG